MPRQRSMSTEKMIELYKAYHLENPGTRYRASDFGKYLRDKGYEVSDKSIRRNMEFRQFLEENHAFEQEENEDLVTFNTLDVNTFLSYNRSREKLVSALQERDRYYYDVSEKAVKAIKKRKEAEAKSRNLERQNRELTEESSALKNRLEEIRTEKGIRQEDFARQMGVSRQTISSLENGRYNPSIMLAYKIAKYFGMTIEEMFIFEEE